MVIRFFIVWIDVIVWLILLLMGELKIMSIDLMIVFTCIENYEVNSDISKYYHINDNNAFYQSCKYYNNKIYSIL